MKINSFNNKYETFGVNLKRNFYNYVVQSQANSKNPPPDYLVLDKIIQLRKVFTQKELDLFQVSDDVSEILIDNKLVATINSKQDLLKNLSAIVDILHGHLLWLKINNRKEYIKQCFTDFCTKQKSKQYYCE